MVSLELSDKSCWWLWAGRSLSADGQEVKLLAVTPPPPLGAGTVVGWYTSLQDVPLNGGLSLQIWAAFPTVHHTASNTLVLLVVLRVTPPLPRV